LSHESYEKRWSEKETGYHHERYRKKWNDQGE
jgi:hypothetical protein